MKVLFVVDSFNGGAGNVIQILAKEFCARGYEISILLLNGKKVEEKYDLTGVKIIDYPLSKMAPGRTPIDRVYKSVRTIRKVFLQENPDIIVSFLTELNILCLMANRGVKPIIISERNDPSKDKVKSYWKCLRTLTYSAADKIVVQCSNFRSFCGNKYYTKSIVIANPILKAPITHEVKDNRQLKFVSLGRLSKQKNFPWLIDCMVEINKVLPEVSLDIYGMGEERNNIQQYINSKELDNVVKLCGYTKNTYDTLSQADIYLMTSDYEGFPNSLSEAMAVGLPSVSRKCHEGLNDLVEDGVSGILVGMDEKSEFIENVLKLTKDANFRRKMSNEARKRVDSFSVIHIADKWERIINEVLET